MTFEMWALFYILAGMFYGLIVHYIYTHGDFKYINEKRTELNGLLELLPKDLRIATIAIAVMVSFPFWPIFLLQDLYNLAIGKFS